MFAAFSLGYGSTIIHILFSFFSRKPRPFGKNYHTIADALSGILYELEIVKGKDQPQEIHSKFDEMETTVGLLIYLIKKL